MRNMDETGNKSLGDNPIYIAGVILQFYIKHTKLPEPCVL